MNVDEAGHNMLTLAELGGFATQFAADNPDVRAVAVLSTDGLMLAGSGMDQEAADRMAATACGLTSLALSGSMNFNLGDTTHVMVAYEHGNLLVIAVNTRCVMAVLAEPNAKLVSVLYEMNRFAEAHGDAISPTMRSAKTSWAHP